MLLFISILMGKYLIFANASNSFITRAAQVKIVAFFALTLFTGLHPM